MDKIYERLFKKLGFGEVRNKIFDKILSEINTFYNGEKKSESMDIYNKFKEYLITKNSFSYSKFIFKIFIDEIYFYHEDDDKMSYFINTLKKYKISKSSDGKNAIEE